jgi:hypothetical protein
MLSYCCCCHPAAAAAAAVLPTPTPQQRGSQGTSAAARGTSSADCWQSVPDDVLQAMVSYLSPCDVALARLVCRHWRCILSCYTPALTIPTR